MNEKMMLLLSIKLMEMMKGCSKYSDDDYNNDKGG